MTFISSRRNFSYFFRNSCLRLRFRKMMTISSRMERLVQLKSFLKKTTLKMMEAKQARSRRKSKLRKLSLKHQWQLFIKIAIFLTWLKMFSDRDNSLNTQFCQKTTLLASSRIALSTIVSVTPNDLNILLKSVHAVILPTHQLNKSIKDQWWMKRMLSLIISRSFSM